MGGRIGNLISNQSIYGEKCGGSNPALTYADADADADMDADVDVDADSDSDFTDAADFAAAAAAAAAATAAAGARTGDHGYSAASARQRAAPHSLASCVDANRALGH